MIAIRKAHSAFGNGSMQWLKDNPAVASYLREYEGETLLILNNLSSDAQEVNIPAEHQGTYSDLMNSATLTLAGNISLQPYSYLWLQRQK
jgi:glycosidase